GVPGTDARGDRTTDAGAVLPGDKDTNLIDRDQLAERHAFHDGIDFTRRGYGDRPVAPTAGHLAGDRHDLGKILTIGKLLAPGFALWHEAPPGEIGKPANSQSRACRSRSEFPTTDSELRLMAALATIGGKVPKAASGILAVL